jgi:polyisoprenoid-binding protein YceI
MGNNSVLHLDQSHGSLLVRTSVEGRAARMGHRLTLQIAQWTAEVSLTDSQPTSAVLRADLTALDVLAGEGGVTPLTPIDRSVITRNAAKSLKTKEHPGALFTCPRMALGDTIATKNADIALSGSLLIAGITRPLMATVHAQEADGIWQVSTTSTVRQSDFGIKPYSLMVGAIRVGDDVAIEFHARIPAVNLE